MIETRNSEINIEELKQKIRLAVERREAEGRMSFARASADLFELLSREDFSVDRWLNETSRGTDSSLALSPVRLQPEFVPQPAYHVNDLLKYHDFQFVWNAYRALLKREPDEVGLNQHLQQLRSGRINKIDVLARVRYSPEGQRENVPIEGLRFAGIVRRAFRLPVIGYALELMAGVVRLPRLIHGQRQSEAYLIAQQERIADQLTQAQLEISRQLGSQRELIESLRSAIAEVAHQQKQVARLQHQQLAAVMSRHATNGQPAAAKLQGDTTESEPQQDFDELYAAFQKQFRSAGPSRENLKVYLTVLAEAAIDSEILDLGCGGGDWLAVMREAGLRARGVESNRTLTAEARGRNLLVTEADAISYLRTLPEESLRAVTAFHFVEHLRVEELIDVLKEVRRTLKPGGLLILETPNPKNLVVGACNFYSDPTHTRPLFPETLEFVITHLGFEGASIRYLHPVEGSPFGAEDESARALDSWFFSPRDYAVVAHRPAPRAAEVGSEPELISLTANPAWDFFGRARTDDQLIFDEVVVANEYELPSTFGDSDVVVDIGAHIGSFSYAVATRGAGKVYAFEAHPDNAALASRNLAQFGHRALCRNLAVWRSDVNGRVLFNDPLDDRSDRNTGGHAVVYNTSGIPIESIGLDEILREVSADFTKPVRLLKIDVEGSEYPILFSSKHLAVIEEICGEYHNVDPQVMPEHARVKGMPENFTGEGLKEFFESSGWTVVTKPNPDNLNLGHFRARRAKASRTA